MQLMLVDSLPLFSKDVKAAVVLQLFYRRANVGQKLGATGRPGKQEFFQRFFNIAHFPCNKVGQGLSIFVS